MKKTKKTFTPDYTLDFSKINDYNDLVIELTKKRVEAGKTIDSSDLIALESATLLKFCEKNPRVTVFTINAFDCKEKKLPWYKRFWNWLTRKK